MKEFVELMDIIGGLMLAILIIVSAPLWFIPWLVWRLVDL